MSISWAKCYSKKNHHFEISSSLTLCNNEPFLDWTVMKSGFYITTGNDQLSSWTDNKLQNTSQSQTCTKKRSWSLVVWSYSFLNPSETIHLREVYSANQWEALKTARPAGNTGQQKGLSSSPPPHLTTRHATTFQKLNKLGYDVFPHLSYSPDLSPTDYHFYKNLDNFFQGKCFHNQPRVHRIPKHGLLCYRNEKSYFLLAKMCWL